MTNSCLYHPSITMFRPMPVLPAMSVPLSKCTPGSCWRTRYLLAASFGGINTPSLWPWSGVEIASKIATLRGLAYHGIRGLLSAKITDSRPAGSAGSELRDEYLMLRVIGVDAMAGSGWAVPGGVGSHRRPSAGRQDTCLFQRLTELFPMIR